MNKIGVKISAVFLTAVFALVGCTNKTDNATQESNASKNGKLKVYTSFYPMYDFSKKIGGNKVDVTNLIPAGTEPHDWEPTPQDLVNISKSDVLVYSGAGMESWIDKLSKNIDSKKIILVEASKGVKLIKSSDEDKHDHDDKEDKHDDKEDKHDHNDKEDKHDHDDKEDKHDHDDKEDKHDHDDKEDMHDHGEYDPHVWLNPQNAKIQMKNIANAFSKADPKNKNYYEENLKKYSEKLDELDNKFKTELAKTKKKDIIVAHEAFGYLSNAYGLNQIGIEGLSPDSEPDAAKMAQIVRFAKDKKVKYIFFEELVSPKVSEAIAKEVGAKTAVLNPIEGLKEEQLKAGEDYFSIMENNLKVLLQALNA